MLLLLPCLLQGDSKAAQYLPPVAHAERGLRSPCVSSLPGPRWARWHLSSPLATPTRPCPIHEPHLGHPCVVCLLEREWVGREPGGLTFRGTVMTMGSHLRSCSL